MKHLRKLHLALRKLGFSGAEINAMSHVEADGYLEAYSEVINPEKKTTYVVKRDAGKGNSKRRRRSGRA